MMRAVWKFELSLQDHINLALPPGTELLTVQEQHGVPMLWCLCDTETDQRETRTFRIAGTGHPIKEDYVEYVGTFQLRGGSFVGHLFEVLE